MAGSKVAGDAPVLTDVRLVGMIDLGKTSCRLRVVRAPEISSPLYEITDVGAPGLASHQGVQLAVDSVTAVLAQYREASGHGLDAVVIGAAGTEASPQGARELAASIRRQYGAQAVVASDVVIAHAGAFAGAAGTVLVAGTGAVALGLAEDGEFAQVDGWGPWVGDEGSGRWIGQEGLKAALRSADGRGPVTALAATMRDVIGKPLDLPGWVSRGDSPARTLATFALAVIDAAQRGDAVAEQIIDDAVEHLAATAGAATKAGGRVVLTGGLIGNDHFAHRVRQAIGRHKLSVVDALGSALDGAYLIAVNSSLPHERKVFRA